MTTLPEDLAREFCHLCNWAYYCWQFHRAAFMENPREDELAPTVVGHALGRLSLMTQEYGLLQIIKLHDPPTTGKATNLGIAYVVENGGWSKKVHTELQKLQRDLDTLGRDILHTARNKAICHNDLAAIVSRATFGAFRDGDDEKYFSALQAFVNIVFREVTGEDYPFDRLGKPAGVELTAAIRSGSELKVATCHPIPR